MIYSKKYDCFLRNCKLIILICFSNMIWPLKSFLRLHLGLFQLLCTVVLKGCRTRIWLSFWSNKIRNCFRAKNSCFCFENTISLNILNVFKVRIHSCDYNWYMRETKTFWGRPKWSENRFTSLKYKKNQSKIKKIHRTNQMKKNSQGKVYTCF